MHNTYLHYKRVLVWTDPHTSHRWHMSSAQARNKSRPSTHLRTYRHLRTSFYQYLQFYRLQIDLRICYHWDICEYLLCVYVNNNISIYIRVAVSRFSVYAYLSREVYPSPTDPHRSLNYDHTPCAQCHDRLCPSSLRTYRHWRCILAFDLVVYHDAIYHQIHRQTLYIIYLVHRIDCF